MTEATSETTAPVVPPAPPAPGHVSTGRRIAGVLAGVAGALAVSGALSAATYFGSQKVGFGRLFDIATLAGRARLAGAGFAPVATVVIGSKIVSAVKSKRSQSTESTAITAEALTERKGTLRAGQINSRDLTHVETTKEEVAASVRLMNKLKAEKETSARLQGQLTAANGKLRAANGKLQAIAKRASASRWGLSKAEVARLVS